MNESELLAAGGIIGYLFGKGNEPTKSRFSKEFDERWNLLRGFKIYPPTNFLKKNENVMILYREAVNCYLFDLPNSSIPGMVRLRL